MLAEFQLNPWGRQYLGDDHNNSHNNGTCNTVLCPIVAHSLIVTPSFFQPTCHDMLKVYIFRILSVETEYVHKVFCFNNSIYPIFLQNMKLNLTF